MRLHLAPLLLVFACSSPSSPGAGPDGGPDDKQDERELDASTVQPGVDAGPYDPGPRPTAKLQPKPGELTFIQLELPPGASARLGEAAIIVGPDGSIALLDIGNNPHDDEVREAVRELNTRWLTPARGFSKREPLQVEWIIVTHVHGDHVGAFRDLLINNDPLTGVRGIVHRGFVDLGKGMNETDYDEFCSGIRSHFAKVERPLCVAADTPACDFASLPTPYPAVHCNNLLTGDLETEQDDNNGEPTRIHLGRATITFIGANGHFNDGKEIAAIPPFGHDTGDEENGRSVVGIVSLGDFRYHFGGDLHGRGTDGETDVESFLVKTSAAAFYGRLGVDVIHAHHHARRSSSNPTFIEAMAPKDGYSRNVIAGINKAHLGSPFEEVITGWTDGNRLGAGRLWITTGTAGGADSPMVTDADGSLVVQTVQGGQGYWVQAVGDTLTSASYRSVRHSARETGSP